jgi:hypothetical protein
MVSGRCTAYMTLASAESTSGAKNVVWVPSRTGPADFSQGCRLAAVPFV